MANSLGRGLDSLIPKKVNKKVSSSSGETVAVDVVSPEDKDRILRLSPDEIKINSMQPRQNFDDVRIDELSKSIKEHGIIQPLVVINSGNGYELIAGERRLRAAKKIGLSEVPAIIREAGEQEKLEVALIENLQRENLNPIETAIAYQKLIDEFNLTQEEVAKKVGKSRPVITNSLRLLNLSLDIQDALISGKISEGHAKFLAGLESEEKRKILLHKIINKNLTVQETNNEARRMGGTKKARIKINYRDKDKEFALREFFGTRAEIKRKGKGGQIIIDFYSDDELEELINKIS